jgi:integrase
MARSTNGSGHVFQRKDGRWAATVRLNGKRFWKYADSEKAANQALRQLLKDHTLGKVSAPTRATLGQWMEEWLGEKETHLRPSTMRGYRQPLGPVLADLGKVPLHRLTTPILAQTFSQLRAKGHGARRLQLAHGAVKAALRQAVDLEVLTSNPMDRVPRPRFVPQKREYWTVEQTGQFVSTALSDHTKWAPFFVLLTTCGLRMSEALGLRWRDVDLQARTVHIERAIVWSGTQYHVGPVKTKSALRDVVLPEPALQAMASLPRALDPDQAVFLADTGRPPTPHNLRRDLHALCAKADVPPINIHGLRHVAATMALKISRDPYAVQRRLGHSHVSVTVGIYGYGTSDDAELANALGELLRA